MRVGLSVQPPSKFALYVSKINNRTSKSGAFRCQTSKNIPHRTSSTARNIFIVFLELHPDLKVELNLTSSFDTIMQNAMIL